MDIGLKPSLSGWDISYQDGDFSKDASLRTAVVLSLAIHARADENEVSPEQNPRGWWADLGVGSKLWLILRETISESTPIQIEGYVRESLQWMIDEGIALDPIQVSARRVSIDRISVTVEIRRVNNSEEIVIFNDLWAEIEGILPFNPSTQQPAIVPVVREANYLVNNGNRMLVNGMPMVGNLSAAA